MVVPERNPYPLPPIQYEERQWKPIEWHGYDPGWQSSVCIGCRLNMHHTLASFRWHHRLKGPLCPRHSLDLSLSAIYTHGPETFPEKSDFIRQPETVGLPTWRLLRNKRYDPTLVPYNVDALGMPAAGSEHRFASSAPATGPAPENWDPKLPQGVDPTHPLRYGGLAERRNPFSVKLGISSIHSPPSKNGYGRNSYGAFYTS